MMYLLVDGPNNNYFWGILLLMFLAFGVPFILFVLALAKRKTNKKVSKILLIIGVVYSLVGLGYCGAIGI